MQHKPITFVLLIFSIIWSIQARAGELHLKVSGLTATTGKVYLILCHNAECFKNLDSDDSYFYALSARMVESEQVSFTFAELPKGDYAVFAFHDVNGNEDLDTTLLGWPKEPYGFSNKLTLESNPKFHQAKFEVSQTGEVSQTIQLARL